MNFNKFADDKFDAKTWINEALKGEDVNNNKEKAVRTMLARLEAGMDAINGHLASTSDEAMSVVPRCVHDMDKLQQEAIVLRTALSSVVNDVASVEQSTLSAMDELVRLEGGKQRLKKVQQTLQEADNWSTLISDVDALFRSGDAAAMFSRIQQIEKCMKILSNKVTDHAERKRYVDALVDQFAAAISPSVVGAFNQNNADNTIYFARMLCTLQRQNTLDQYYRLCIKNKMLEKLNTIMKSKDSDDAVHLLTEWYTSIMELATQQMEWLKDLAANFEKAIADEDQLSDDDDDHALDKPSAINFWPQDISATLCSAIAHTLNEASRTLQEKLSVNVTNSQKQLDVIAHLIEIASHTAHQISTITNASKLHERDLYSSCLSSILPILHSYAQYVQSALVQFANGLSVESTSIIENVDEIERSIIAMYDEAMQTIQVAYTSLGACCLAFVGKPLKQFIMNYLTRLRKSIHVHYQKMQLARDANEELNDKSAEPVQNWKEIDAILHLVQSAGVLYQRQDAFVEQISLISDSLAHIESNQQPIDFILYHDEKLSPLIKDYIRVIDNANYFADTTAAVDKVASRTVRLCQETLVSSILPLIVKIPKMTDTWHAEGDPLPSYAHEPMAYVTKIGHYIMTLAHQLSPYATTNYSGEHDMRCVLLRSVPPTLQTEFDDRLEDKSGQEQKTVTDFIRATTVAHVWLSSVVYAISARYVESSLRIRYISASGAAQLAQDLQYLCACLDDVGVQPALDLIALRQLLVMDKQKIKEHNLEFKYTTDGNVEVTRLYPSAMLAAVRDMRKPITQK